ncbi:MAG TPA: cobalamin B12-binding domain-containing protein [Nitrospiria bacterium]|nr:cobalamin B12-binding domain-containing protein [Nitrospiria bacterium]
MAQGSAAPVARSLKKGKKKPVKVLVAKIGLDGHDRGIKIIAQSLRDAGYEVLYLGIHNSPEEIVHAAVQEDPAAIGLSIHSAAHMVLIRKVLSLLKKNGASDIGLFAGGIIPDEDRHKLLKMGLLAVFTPGVSMDLILSTLDKALRKN